MRLKIRAKKEDLEKIKIGLGLSKGDEVIDINLDNVPMVKETFEYLVKSNEVIDWDFQKTQNMDNLYNDDILQVNTVNINTVERKKSPEELLTKLRPNFDGYDALSLITNYINGLKLGKILSLEDVIKTSNPTEGLSNEEGIHKLSSYIDFQVSQFGVNYVIKDFIDNFTKHSDQISKNDSLSTAFNKLYALRNTGLSI